MSAAAAYTRLRRSEAAERAYRRAIELTPLRAGGYAALASFFLQTQRNLEEAGRLAEKAVALEPTAENQFLLSMTRRMRGDLVGSLSALEAAIALAPQNNAYQQVRRELNRLMQTAAPGAERK
jgi:tetratricopeptide (TPR) repeat protein